LLFIQASIHPSMCAHNRCVVLRNCPLFTLAATRGGVGCTVQYSAHRVYFLISLTYTSCPYYGGREEVYQRRKNLIKAIRRVKGIIHARTILSLSIKSQINYTIFIKNGSIAVIKHISFARTHGTHGVYNSLE
jgi:hypothetical protein